MCMCFEATVLVQGIPLMRKGIVHYCRQLTQHVAYSLLI
jgi:hypothetical protein